MQQKHALRTKSDSPSVKLQFRLKDLNKADIVSRDIGKL